ncbi:MAG: helix-turn-helix transcriptional regulator [Nitrososphaerota archaeon]|nr:helix-turn-helix transcriptional regulator [Nitrososphaerota archaeon]
MTIILRLDRVMADRKMALNELTEKVGITNVNLSNIKTGKISAIRFSTLNTICDVLKCQIGDIPKYKQSTSEKAKEEINTNEGKKKNRALHTFHYNPCGSNWLL